MNLTKHEINLNGRGDKPFFAAFMYIGENATKMLDKAVKKYVNGREFYEFIDDNNDNPWIRVILQDLEGFKSEVMTVENSKFELSTLHKDNQTEVYFLTYLDGPDPDRRPYPIIQLALMKLAGQRSYNSFIDSELSDVWSRLVVFGLNEIPQSGYSI